MNKTLTLYPMRCPLKDPGEGATQLIAMQVLVTRPPLKFLGASEGTAKKQRQNRKDALKSQ